MFLWYPYVDKSSTWSKFSHVEIKFIRLKICTPLTKTQNHRTFKWLIKNPQSSNTETLLVKPSLTQTLLCPLKLTHSLTHSQAIVAHCQQNYSPPCRRYSLSLLNMLSFLLLRFLCLSLSFSSFRFWKMMLPRVFHFSISDLFGFWWFMFGFREKNLRF